MSTHTQPLIKLQNKIVSIITNSHFLASSEKLYNETSILLFVTLVKYRIGLLMFKIAKHTVPISISRLYKLNSDVHIYNTRQAHHIHSFIHSREIINSFIEHLGFKVFIFGITFSRILILMYLFPHLNIYWNVSYWITIPLLDTTNKIV